MGWNDHVDFDLSDKLGAMIDAGGYLEEGTPAYGIVKLVSDAGEGILSDKQRHVYTTIVLPALEQAIKDGVF
ncbi:hypothetical protein [Oleisolibacter albus]|uniref:hypothetical protein n=1 Tax=Oleisolibacter albus TaxID=2171757 RepID=UPI000DF1FA6A|nr:hypothetical protein [Oleisolibacter albus]